ncbi:hypothetical protein ACVBIL_12505 [Shewanella sp. 125m-7]
MKFGPVTYLMCNICQLTLCHRPMISVDGRHADLWSDGYVDSPMIPEPCLVVTCGHCDSTIWLPELAISKNSINAVDYHKLSEEGMHDWLAVHANTPSEHELHIRQKLWQRSNHRYRRNERAIDWSEFEAQNLGELLGLLDMQSTSESMIAVEIYRQLGAFTKAEQKLEQISSALPLDLVTQVMNRIEAKDRRVFSLKMALSQ